MTARLAIQSANPETATVLIYGEIGEDFFGEGVTAKDFRNELKAVKSKTLNLRINSPGGSVFHASAIMAALDEFKGRVEVDIDGVAASAASIVAMAGDEIRMAPMALMMIHNAHCICVGQAADMRAMAELLDKCNQQVIDAYERHSKKGREQLAAWMDAETWFNGAEAVAAGLAHKVTEGRKVAACAGLKEVAAKLKFRHVPDALTKQAETAWAETERRKDVAAKLCQPA